MSADIPQGWHVCRLEDCVEVLDSLRVPVNNDERQSRIEGKPTEQLFPYYGATGQVGFIDDFLFDEELVALGEDGVPFLDPLKSKAYMLRGKTWVNNHAHVLRSLEGVAINKFVFYYLNQFDYQGYVNGGTRLKLTQANMRMIPVPLPPLAEQTRIAQKLDELLAQVDTLKARIDGIPALLKRFRQSVLAAAVSGRLTEEWRIERALPEFFEVELGHLIKEGPQNGLYKPSSAYGSGVKIIRIDGFYSGEITDWERLRLLEVDQRELEAWGIREGEILINRVNSIEYLGKCALVRSVPEPTVFESNIMRMSLKRDLVHPEYLMRFLSSEIGRRKLIAKAKHAVNQASINQGDVKACKVPLPSVEEQTEIVRRVKQLFAFADQLEAKVASAKSRIDLLTQSILAKAFRGELVPQDPNEEPASVLLERIKTQRATAPKTKRARKNV
ncbi:TPA: restriction endonuclease subunit S [Pseudomonas aeruginosa]